MAYQKNMQNAQCEMERKNSKLGRKLGIQHNFLDRLNFIDGNNISKYINNDSDNNDIDNNK